MNPFNSAIAVFDNLREEILSIDYHMITDSQSKLLSCSPGGDFDLVASQLHKFSTADLSQAEGLDWTLLYYVDFFSATVVLLHAAALAGSLMPDANHYSQILATLSNVLIEDQEILSDALRNIDAIWMQVVLAAIACHKIEFHGPNSFRRVTPLSYTGTGQEIRALCFRSVREYCTSYQYRRENDLTLQLCIKFPV